jgi:hypothetical protein
LWAPVVPDLFFKETQTETRGKTRPLTRSLLVEAAVVGVAEDVVDPLTQLPEDPVVEKLTTITQIQTIQIKHILFLMLTAQQVVLEIVVVEGIKLGPEPVVVVLEPRDTTATIKASTYVLVMGGTDTAPQLKDR